MPQTRRAPARPPQRRSSDLMARVLVAVPAAVLAVVFVDIGGIGWMLLMAILACACLSELYRMLAEWRPVPFVGFVVAIGMCFAARYGTLADVVGAALVSLPLVFISILSRGQSEGGAATITATLLGVLWIALPFACAVLLRQVTGPGGAHIGKGILIDVMVGTFLGDTAAYLGGRMFGRHPLAPMISPKKTIEGLGCGALATIVSIVVAGLYQQTWLPHSTALLLGIAVALLAPAGDLFESLIKRDVGIKDAGAMFGAHGGALDRLDAILFTVVVGYYIAIHIS
ncbi:MAG TPA: phosphatidate cytidylyltransferase [Solirubrobacteraceae bacterium]|nr:phosphatidate cytidylyltransferase [Solirubrobacteraceae bacterium]